MSEQTQTIFTLDAGGRPHIVVANGQRVPADPVETRQTFTLADGTPVEQVGRGRFRTAGPPPHIELFAADADPANLAVSTTLLRKGKWSGTETVSLIRRRPAP